MKSPISMFCEEKGVPAGIADAFAAYARSVYADRFLLRHDTDTVRLMVNRLTKAQMNDLWQEFVVELKRTLVTIQEQTHLVSPSNKDPLPGG